MFSKINCKSASANIILMDECCNCCNNSVLEVINRVGSSPMVPVPYV